MLSYTIKNIFLIFLSAGLLALSFSRLNLGLCAWFGLVPLFFALEKKALKERFIFSFIFGFLFFLFTIYWIGHVSVLGLIILCFYLSLFFCLFGILAKTFVASSSFIIIPFFWVLPEALRSFLLTGFGWALLGYTQFRNLWLIQIADKVGVWGISFIIVAVNVLVFQLMLAWPDLRRRAFVFILALSLLLVFYLYGAYRLAQKFPGQDITISVVQGNISQERKWDPEYINYILERYQDLTLLAKKDNPDLIVWPETAIPGYLLDEPRLLRHVVGLAQKINTPLLVGSPREEKSGVFYNSAFLFDGEGTLISLYDKIHLVPFGEYVPFGEIFLFAKNMDVGDFSAGNSYTIFEQANRGKKTVRFAVLICFEDIFPNLVRRFKKEGAGFIINITNEAWFKISAEPAQHLAMSVFRAIENRIWFVRCANTGISCFIDPSGRVRRLVEKDGEGIFVEGVATMKLSSD